MIVLKTVTDAHGDLYKGFETLEDANVFWKALIDKASQAVGRKTDGLVAELYEADFDAETIAIGAVKSGNAICIRKVSLKPSNNLRKKVSRSGANVVTPERLAEAQAVLEKYGEDFASWAMQDFAELEALLSIESAGANVNQHLQAMYKVSYRLKGRGGTFGYQLITNVADHLCNMLEDIDIYDVRVQTAIRTHLDTMKYVIAKDIKGEGGAGDWDALLVGLQRVVAKVSGQGKGEDGDG